MVGSQDHHYIPQFLLRQWCNQNGLLTVFSRPYYRVVTTERNPRGTGYEPNLYAYEQVPQDHRQVIEEKFLTPHIDGPAAIVLQKLLDGGTSSLMTHERSDFTRFVMSLRARHPDAIAQAKAEGDRTLKEKLEQAPEEYLSVIDAGAPPTLLEWVEENVPPLIPNVGLSIIPDVITDHIIGARIFNAAWMAYDARQANTDFLLGDRPCLLIGDATSSGDFSMAFPISPTVIFLISTKRERLEAIGAREPTEVVKRFNRDSVVFASQRVFSTGGHHRPLVEKYLKLRPYPV
jgi:Protein of unknown function (DUF4238)